MVNSFISLLGMQVPLFGIIINSSYSEQILQYYTYLFCLILIFYCNSSLHKASLRVPLARICTTTSLLRGSSVTKNDPLDDNIRNEIRFRLRHCQPASIDTRFIHPFRLTFGYRKFSSDNNSDTMADAAVAAKGSSKKDSFGGYRNRLGLEKSPYLLQHANNPVDWWSIWPSLFILGSFFDCQMVQN